VKLIPKDASDQRSARLLQRVRLEGDLLLALDHPHIVRGYGVMETDSHAFLFMEHAQGGDLLEYLNREGALTETRARLMFRQVVRAVRHLHQRGWVHRDIKVHIYISFISLYVFNNLTFVLVCVVDTTRHTAGKHLHRL
jgi:serine/threonine protein kinase